MTFPFKCNVFTRISDDVGVGCPRVLGVNLLLYLGLFVGSEGFPRHPAFVGIILRFRGQSYWLIPGLRFRLPPGHQHPQRYPAAMFVHPMLPPRRVLAEVDDEPAGAPWEPVSSPQPDVQVGYRRFDRLTATSGEQEAFGVFGVDSKFFALVDEFLPVVVLCIPRMVGNNAPCNLPLILTLLILSNS